MLFPRPILSPGVRVADVTFLKGRQFLLQLLECRHGQGRAVQIQLAQTLHAFFGGQLEKITKYTTNEIHESFTRLTGQTCEAFVGDGRLAQVEHLQFVEVLANQLKASIAKL